jgi:hypothetical protein
LPQLVAVAGSRWRVEESFQAAKTDLGLDQHQHRRWRAWHHWTTLVIAAHTFLAAATTISTTNAQEMIAITANELRRLFHALIIDPHAVSPTLSPGQSSDASIKPHREPAITPGKPSQRRRTDLLLEY